MNDTNTKTIAENIVLGFNYHLRGPVRRSCFSFYSAGRNVTRVSFADGLAVHTEETVATKLLAGSRIKRESFTGEEAGRKLLEQARHLDARGTAFAENVEAAIGQILA